MSDITGERVGDVIIVKGDNFSFEAVGDVSVFNFSGNIKGRRVVRDNVKAIKGVMLNG